MMQRMRGGLEKDVRVGGGDTTLGKYKRALERVSNEEMVAWPFEETELVCSNSWCHYSFHSHSSTKKTKEGAGMEEEGGMEEKGEEKEDGGAMEEEEGNDEAEEEVTEEEDMGEMWKEMLHQRVIQHNLLTASKYYSQITTTRLADILSISIQVPLPSLPPLVSHIV